MTSVKNLTLVQTIARANLGRGEMDSSARSCLADSIALSNKENPSAEDWHRAACRALRSIAYSVGICHADYKRAWKAAGMEGEPKLVS